MRPAQKTGAYTLDDLAASGQVRKQSALALDLANPLNEVHFGSLKGESIMLRLTAELSKDALSGFRKKLKSSPEAYLSVKSGTEKFAVPASDIKSIDLQGGTLSVALKSPRYLAPLSSYLSSIAKGGPTAEALRQAVKDGQLSIV